jgi:hypothetical protein
MTQPPADVPPSEATLPAAATPAAATPDAALFTVANGDATPEQIAALTAVLAAATAARHRDGVPVTSPAGVPGWADRSRLMRSPLAHAPGGWRASARPR